MKNFIPFIILLTSCRCVTCIYQENPNLKFDGINEYGYEIIMNYEGTCNCNSMRIQGSINLYNLSDKTIILQTIDIRKTSRSIMFMGYKGNDSILPGSFKKIQYTVVLYDLNEHFINNNNKYNEKIIKKNIKIMSKKEHGILTEIAFRYKLNDKYIYDEEVIGFKLCVKNINKIKITKNLKL
jgi:hypothetical protein